VRARSLNIESRTDRLVDAREFVSAAAQELGFGDDDIGKIALAVDEACTNVIKHAYHFDGQQYLTITVEAGKNSIEIRITDSGERFDPRELPAPDMKEYLKKFRKGGLGVYLMKKLMDEVEYQLLPGKKNEVRLVKYLDTRHS